eukprot:scaffold4155_cov165-Amphora_coffeaeformis.AAC.13
MKRSGLAMDGGRIVIPLPFLLMNNNIPSVILFHVEGIFEREVCYRRRSTEVPRFATPPQDNARFSTSFPCVLRIWGSLTVGYPHNFGSAPCSASRSS